jgi:O-antigen/teichoic acid export membrane protein
MMNTKRAPRRGGMVRNVLHLGLGQVGTTVLGLLLSATLARVLSSPDFGLMYLLMSIVTFAYVIIDWGHGQYIIRETARHPERSGDLMGSALTLRTAAAVLACPVMFATTWLLGYDMRTRLLTCALILGWLPQYLGLSFGWVFRGIERMDRDALINVVLKLATLVGSIVALLLGGRLLGLVIAWSLAGGLTLALGISIYRRLELPAIHATLSTARELLRDGAPMLTMSLSAAVEPFINVNILYKMASPTVVGWLGAAWNVAGTLLAPATILAATMYPRMSTAAGDAAEFKRTFDISFRLLLLFAVLCAVGTFLFADVPVAIIYSLPKFAPTGDILRVFAPVLLLMYVDMFLVSAIMASGRTVRLAIAKVTSVALTTGLVFVLIPICQARFSNGGLGVMYAMALGELMMLLAAGFFIREVLDRRNISDMCRSLLTGVATILLFRWVPTLTPFLAIPLCILAFGGLSLLFGAVKPSDVEMLLGSFRKPSPQPR